MVEAALSTFQEEVSNREGLFAAGGGELRMPGVHHRAAERVLRALSLEVVRGRKWVKRTSTLQVLALLNPRGLSWAIRSG